MATKAKLECNARHLAKLEKIQYWAANGAKAEIEAAAESAGMRYEAYIRSAVEEKMKRDRDK